MTARRGYPAVDRFHVAAALLVVCIHTAPLASFSAAADFALKTLARLAVPFFFTATGFFLLGELVRPGLRPRTLSPGVRRFLKKTGVLYAACTVLYLPVTLYAGNFPVENVLGELVRDAVLDGTFYHLWYLPAALLGVLVVCGLLRFLRPGAAAGVCCIARKRGKKAQIVIDMDDNAAGPILKRLAALPEYKDAFISGSDAFIKAQPGALLVVVDTNRPDFVESEQLLDTCNRVAVIDHHRRAASYIESAALNFHEPYASSASELVSELLQYLIDPGDLLRAEAEALFAGIVLDTKNFTMRTGGRTFEAAALLRRAGVDTADVQRLFQGTLSDMIERYDIIRHAELYHNDIAIAAVEQDIDRVTAAKAADELLTLRGVRASFVLFKHDTGVNLSARSLGEINVQLIMEKLGGGGNSTTAGGQIPDGTVDAVREQLIAAIDQYLEG